MGYVGVNMSICSAKKLNKNFGVISIGGPVPPDREILALNNLKTIGYEVYQPYSCSKYYADYTHDFSNGSAEERLKGMEAVISSSDIDCVLAARGATGSFDIISKIPFEDWGKSKKIFIGNSDVTSILVQMPERAKLASIHGATFGSSFADYNLNQEAKESVDALLNMLTDSNFRMEYQAQKKYDNHISQEGVLLAGNLTMLVSLLGTPFDVSYENKILVLEEVGEAPYRVKRLLDQLYLAGKFNSLKGLCFGRFAKCESPNGPSINDVIEKFINYKIQKRTYPVLSGIEVGHWGKNLPVPIGCKAIIDNLVLKQLSSPIDNP